MDSKPPGPLRLVFAAILIVGGLVFVGIGIPDVLGAQEDEALVAIPGTVESVSSERRRRLVRSNSPNDPSHEAFVHVSYRYEVDGRSYAGDTYSFAEQDESIVGDDEATARVATLRQSTAITVLYDPNNPERAVLVRRESDAAFAGSIVGGAAILLGGLIGIAWLLARRRYLALSAAAKSD